MDRRTLRGGGLRQRRRQQRRRQRRRERDRRVEVLLCDGHGSAADPHAADRVLAALRRLVGRGGQKSKDAWSAVKELLLRRLDGRGGLGAGERHVGLGGLLLGVPQPADLAAAGGCPRVDDERP